VPEVSKLEPPVLLVAMPQVLDPFFHHAVVLLLAHEEQGSFGFLLNRQTDVKVADILGGLELAWAGPEAMLADFGGPVQPQLGTVLWSPPQPLREDSEPMHVLPGVALSQNLADLAVLASAPPERLRMFLGYAGWGAGQLMDEILRNDWLTAPAQSEFLFTVPRESLWETALRSVGVDPAALPSWTAISDEGNAN
jgi:putative transcriptional regulator